jgi:hypothetical protein
MRVELSVARVMPELSVPAKRLAGWLSTEDFSAVRSALAKRILRELNGPRRLRPGDAEGEIAILRALAMALTAASGKSLPLDDVTAAFAARSKSLVTAEFVESYLGENRTAVQEAEALVWLVENVIGGANKREAGRWLSAVVSSLKFEKEARGGDEGPATKLAKLADLQRSIARAGLQPEDYEATKSKLGELGGIVESEARLTAQVARAGVPAVQRLVMLLKLATGEAAPLGPAADRAKAEAMKLVRLDETRAELVQSPERAAQVRDLIQAMSQAA